MTISSTTLRRGRMLPLSMATAAVLIGAGLLATAVLAATDQLFWLAGLACAACADPSNGIDTAGAVGGVVGAGTAVAGTAAGGGTPGTGGADDPSSREPWQRKPTRDARIPDPYDDGGDQTPWESLPPRPPDAWYEDRRLIEASEKVQKWAEGWIGVERKGTAPASKA